MTHTPGPWKFYNAYDLDNGQNKSIMFTRLGNSVYTILQSSQAGVDCMIGNESDADLIAAAPDLLKACEAMLPIIQYILSDGWITPPSNIGLDEFVANEKAVVAIAKVKGDA